MVVKDEWRPIQFFLHENDDDPLAVAEVQTRTVPHEDSNELILFRCTCQEYMADTLTPCMHIGIVFGRILEGGGSYVTPMRRNDIDEDLLIAARTDLEAYRHLMVHESMIEVTDDATR